MPETQIFKETVKFFAVGIHNVAATATAITLPRLPDGETVKGYVLKAPGPTDDDPNTLSVFVSNSSGLTVDQAATGGFPIAPGETFPFPLDSSITVYTRAADANQKLNIVAI